MKTAFHILSMIGLVSCATIPADPLLGPDGTPHEVVSCEYGIEDCYRDARGVCGGNYKIVNTSSQVKTDVAGDSYSETSLLIKCESAGPHPAQAQNP